MEGYLKVTPQKLFSASEEFGALGSSMSSLTSEMMNLVAGMQSVWSGEASVSYSNKFRSLDEDMNKLYRMVMEHSQDLCQMAESYQQAEDANTQTGSSMISGIVV